MFHPSQLWRSPHARSIALYSIVANALMLAPSIHMLQVYDRVLHSRSIATLLYLTLIVLGAVALWAMVDTARGRIATRAAADYVVRVSPKLFAQLCRPDRDSASRGKALRDLAAVRGFLGGRSFVALFDLPFVPFYILILSLLHWSLGLLTIASVAVLCLIGWLNIAATEADRARARDADNGAIGFGQAVLDRDELLRAAGLQSRFLSMWGRQLGQMLNLNERAARHAGVYQVWSKGIRQGVQVLVMALGAYLVVEGKLSAGMIFLCSMVSGKALAPIDQVIGGWEQISRGRAAIREIEAVTGPQKTISERMTLPRPGAHLAAQAVVHAHDPAKPDRRVLDGVDLQVRPGECVLVTGAMGAGKSTLLRILAGAIEPSAGQVTLDGIERSLWASAQWGGLVGYLPQDVDFFPGTVAQNIARFDPEASEEAVVEAARRADAHGAILSLPDGYRTALGAARTRLSAGHRQKIGLARALYGNPQLLVLDEPNASLDAAGERALVEALADARARGAAIVLSAHRLAMIHFVDRIVTLDGGRLVDVTHAPADAAAADTRVVPPQPGGRSFAMKVSA